MHTSLLLNQKKFKLKFSYKLIYTKQFDRHFN